MSGAGSGMPTWLHAARALAERQGATSIPAMRIEDWLAMAKRLYRLNSAGRIVLDYDMKIAEPFRVPGNEAAPDMWRALDALDGRAGAGGARATLATCCPPRRRERDDARLGGRPSW